MTERILITEERLVEHGFTKIGFFGLHMLWLYRNDDGTWTLHHRPIGEDTGCIIQFWDELELIYKAFKKPELKKVEIIEANAE